MKMKKKYRISIHAYDDSTIIEKYLSDDEFKIIQSIADEITERMPTIEIEEIEK